MQKAKQEFLASKSLAVVGVSRTRGFGNEAFKALMKRGYTAYPVNSQADTVEGERCYRSLRDLPVLVDGVVVVVPPVQAERVVADCVSLGIRRVWLQQGAESEATIRLCHENGIEPVTKSCIMMYAAPTGFHSFHRWIWKVLGRL